MSSNEHQDWEEKFIKLAKKYEKLHKKFYDRDFFEVEIADECVADSRKFQNGLCVFNNRLGMAYSVTEIVEVLNHMTSALHDFEFENQKLKEENKELKKGDVNDKNL